jgi:hypothetical protein
VSQLVVASLFAGVFASDIANINTLPTHLSHLNSPHFNASIPITVGDTLDDIKDVDFIVHQPHVLDRSELTETDAVVLVYEFESGVTLDQDAGSIVIVLGEEGEEVVILVDDSLNGVARAARIFGDAGRRAAAAG